MRSEGFKDQIDQGSHAFVMDNGTNSGYPIHGLASFRALQATDITCHSAKLSAQIHQGNDTFERAYFVYRYWEAKEWIEMDVPTDGYVEVELDDLEPESYYEYSLMLMFADSTFLSVPSMSFLTEVYDAVADNGVSVSVYPNPTTDIIHIQGADATEVQIINSLGQLVKTVQGTNEINVGDFADGLYWLRIASAKPLTVYVRPLSKHSH